MGIILQSMGSARLIAQVSDSFHNFIQTIVKKYVKNVKALVELVQTFQKIVHLALLVSNIMLNKMGCVAISALKANFLR